MKTLKNISVAIAIVVVSAASAFAQNHASATASSEARIVSGIALEKVLDLKFGSIVRSADGGSVTLNPNSGEISYKGVTKGQNSSYQTAQFKTTGESSYLYTISLPKEATLTNENGKEKMNVTDFTYSGGAGRLDEKGAQTFNVGATLEVDKNQATGKYVGSFDVAVQYE